MELTNAKALVAKIKSDPETAKIFAGIKNAADFEAEAKKLGYEWSVWTMPSQQLRLPPDRNTAQRVCRL